jgi:hypothetical protein
LAGTSCRPPQGIAHGFCANTVPIVSIRLSGRRQAISATTAFAGAATLVAATAIVNRHFAKKAQRENPPQGRFIGVDGVRLHYVERGNGRPLVLFHGNGSMIQDFESSGLIDLATKLQGDRIRPPGIWT